MKRRSIPIAAVLAALIAAIPLSAYGTDIVFDPTNYAKAVEQLQQDVQMVTQLRTQVENQLKMLQNWGYSQLASIMGSMNRWQGALNESRAIYASPAPAEQLQVLFPSTPESYAEKTDGQMSQVRREWAERGRSALVENRAVQNQVEQDLAPTAQRIEQYVEKSNAAPGVTAAVQAGNEELATVVAQIQALQALEITDGRTDAELQAQLQAEDAYGIAEGRKTLQGMYQHSKSQTPVTNMFPHEND
jgi:P-type conjugative transfer protein TrbJ